MFQRIKDIILSLTNLKLFIFFIISIFLNLILLSFFLEYFGLNVEKRENQIYKFTKIEIFFQVVFFAPLLETLIFQSFLFNYINKLHFYFFKKNNPWLSIIITSCFFGLTHFFNLSYVIITFFLGIIFTLYYYICLLKNYRPFINTILLHSVYNLIIFIAELIFKV